MATGTKVDRLIADAARLHGNITAVTKERNHVIREARKLGASYRELADALGLSAGTISAVLSERSTPRQRGAR